jgi:hypothetical protein
MHSSGATSERMAMTSPNAIHIPTAEAIARLEDRLRYPRKQYSGQKCSTSGEQWLLNQGQSRKAYVMRQVDSIDGGLRERRLRAFLQEERAGSSSSAD